MIALEPPRPYRDSDALFDLAPVSPTRRRGGDVRMELNMSVHVPKHRPRAARASGRRPPAVERAELGLRFAFDVKTFPAAFVVTDVKEGSVAWIAAHRIATLSARQRHVVPGIRPFGIGSRLVGLNGANLLTLEPDEMAKVLTDAVTRATFEGARIKMRFDNINVQQFIGTPDGDSGLGMYGSAVGLLGTAPPPQASANNAKARPSTTQPKRSRPANYTLRRRGGKSARQQRRKPKFKPLYNRFGSTRPIGGNFTTQVRYKEPPMQHTGTQATPSSFGRNPISTQRTSPSFSMGTSTRADWKKIGFNGQTKQDDSGASPQFSCLGLRGGRADFGASERQLPPFKGLDPGIDSPGPAAYPEKTGMGPGSLSMARSATFGAGERKTIATDLGLDSPGPVYDPKDLDEIGREDNPGAFFPSGPANMPPGINLSPFKNYENVDLSWG